MEVDGEVDLDNESSEEEAPEPERPTFTVETKEEQVGGFDRSRTYLNIDLGKGKELTFETGWVAKQANASVLAMQGKTTVMGTVCCTDKPKEDADGMVPLTVDYKERYSAAGKTMSGFIKRDKGVLEDHEMLICRLTDRPLRPLFPEGWLNETQILLYCMGFDNDNAPDVLAINAASAALCLSDIPFEQPVGGVMIGMTNSGEYIVLPTLEERAKCKMTILAAGTPEAISMIEATAEFATEEEFVKGLEVAQDAITKICQGISAFQAACGKDKRALEGSAAALTEVPKELVEKMKAKYGPKLEEHIKNMRNIATHLHSDIIHIVESAALKEFSVQFNEDHVKKAFKKTAAAVFYKMITQTGQRPDGRKLEEVRPITIDQDYIKGPHGSSVFTRGDTQTFATCTLGDSKAQQEQDSIAGRDAKRFYLQYFFPPFCTNEVKQVKKGRREVGHGNLAERSLRATLPDMQKFPYTMRVESFITESCGSSSMASVCGGLMSLVACGCPIKEPIAGVAMGLIESEEKDENGKADVEILTDIAECEDHFGKMDFKIAGGRSGITAIQLDVKNRGVTPELAARVLAQARDARIHMIEIMEPIIEESPKDIPEHIPRIVRFTIDPEFRGRVVGQGGANLMKMQKEFDLHSLNVTPEGFVEVMGLDMDRLKIVRQIILDSAREQLAEVMVPQSSGGSMLNNALPNKGALDSLQTEIPISQIKAVSGTGGKTLRYLKETHNLHDIRMDTSSGRVELIGGRAVDRESCRVEIEQIVEDALAAGVEEKRVEEKRVEENVARTQSKSSEERLSRLQETQQRRLEREREERKREAAKLGINTEVQHVAISAETAHELLAEDQPLTDMKENFDLEMSVTLREDANKDYFIDVAGGSYAGRVEAAKLLDEEFGLKAVVAKNIPAIPIDASSKPKKKKGGRVANEEDDTRNQLQMTFAKMGEGETKEWKAADMEEGPMRMLLLEQIEIWGFSHEEKPDGNIVVLRDC